MKASWRIHVWPISLSSSSTCFPSAHGRRFFLFKQALISSPEADRARAEALWPAVLGLLAGLEALAAGDEDDPAAALETCVEALLAASRSPDGDRLVSDLGSRVSRVAARRRQVLVETREAAARGEQEDDADSAEYELGLWSEWDALTGPAQ
ncbi:unnamed protein product [Ectocarpus fasciculatus]